jgi:putative transposase
VRVLVHAADLREAATAPWRLTAALTVYTQWERLGADLAYRSHARRIGLATAWGGPLELVPPPPRRGLVASAVEPTPRPRFTVLPRRGRVARTIAWIGRSRRLSQEYEYLPRSREPRIDLARSRLRRRRLARQAPSGVPSPQRQGLRGLARAF